MVSPLCGWVRSFWDHLSHAPRAPGCRDLRRGLRLACGAAALCSCPPAPGPTAALPADAPPRRRRSQRRRRRRSGREGGRAIVEGRPPRRHAHKSLETNPDARLAEEQRRQFECERLRAVRRDAPRPLRPVINVAGARAEISGYVEGRPAVRRPNLAGGGHVTTRDGGLDAVAARRSVAHRRRPGPCGILPSGVVPATAAARWRRTGRRPRRSSCSRPARPRPSSARRVHRRRRRRNLWKKSPLQKKNRRKGNQWPSRIH